MKQMNASSSTPIPKIFVLCNQGDTAPVWGYILRQQGLNVILETSVENAIKHWSGEAPDLFVIDIEVAFHLERLELFRKLRAMSVMPILLLMPAYDENQILEAYSVGVDEVVIKPISPPVFLAKIMAWVRRNWVTPNNTLNLIQSGKHRLNCTRRCLIEPNGEEIQLTILEFNLLQLLMSRPGHIFPTEHLIEAIWSDYRSGDQILLKNVVYRLRKKIEPNPSHPILLQTGLGGYSFQG